VLSRSTARGTAVVGGDLLLQARELDVGCGQIPVVRGLDLEVRAGEVVALLGPNGAGKSTSLLGLAGVLKPLAGTVSFLGEETNAPLHVRCRRGMGFVPEGRSAIFSLSARDNLRLGRGDVDAAMALFPELQSLSRRRAGLLSGGEQQILTLARALPPAEAAPRRRALTGPRAPDREPVARGAAGGGALRRGRAPRRAAGAPRAQRFRPRVRPAAWSYRARMTLVRPPGPRRRDRGQLPVGRGPRHRLSSVAARWRGARAEGLRS
jgi:ABC-type uncharacterized transport system YnjBCD ATPase subunit